jgi:hypothetical protein
MGDLRSGRTLARELSYAAGVERALPTGAGRMKGESARLTRRGSRPRRPSASCRCCRPSTTCSSTTRPSSATALTTLCSPRATDGATLSTTYGARSAMPRLSVQRAAGGARPARDRAVHAAHAAAHVRLGPDRAQPAATAGDVSHRPHRPDSDDAGLPAGHRHGEGGLEKLERLVGCTLDEAFAVLSGRGILATNWQPANKNASQPRAWSELEGTERRSCRAFFEAAEGTRTLDLLHGKQTLIVRSYGFIPAYRPHRGLQHAVVCLRFGHFSVQFWHPIGARRRAVVARAWSAPGEASANERVRKAW